ncbi:MAG: uracil-DNA glycosylase [Rickettsiales bacterium]|jgi:DNA polymerase|nr:uracil-DNA glycosylase [Rickettsiales bacterium]
MNNELIEEWYLQNGIYDIIEEIPFSHFLDDVDMNKREKEQIIRSISGIGGNATKSGNVRRDDRSFEKKSVSNFELQKKITESRRIANQSYSVDELRQNIANFDIGDIKRMAKQIVFAEGDVNSDIMIIGEAPGEEEDLQGRPFCGDSGKLLDQMFRSIGIKREQLYITNSFFWRPPANKIDLVKDEVYICKPFVEKHIYLINPKLIVCVGATAFLELTQNRQVSITEARQKVFEYSNEYLKNKINLVAIFHPSYMLRNPIKKKETWQDLLFIKDIIS